ncbi:enoyl-CoA hydratase/carnithine racemase [Rhizobium sp. SG_E_25_P2]|uniref:enoyl-CoA hydratase-related protein n=1 Tax=Rhizobium sp. SG_E_25_P2 TaxID=2879942 RepID=UPI0024770890|nr:enoyl-CoA hydratase-related protein [Rhizobium sp. SG_E_25_P2]MDH6268632.1 enoyl-CoA hydratase/carnithine racemase [Rhizobium sp. SG_E_25_P2]
MELEFAEGKIRLALDMDVARLRICQPARLNALNLAMWRALPEAIGSAIDQQARVILLSGDGAHFSAGADISEFSEVRKDAESARLYESVNVDAFAAVRRSPIPVIALISGSCHGGGFGLVAAADLRLATEDARFSVPPAGLGLAYPASAMRDIALALGQQQARQMLYTGETRSASDMLASGFLLSTHPDLQALHAAAAALTERIAGNAPLSIRAAKLALRAAAEDDAGLERDADHLGAATFESEDYAEGRRAFAEKRRPNFIGR